MVCALPASRVQDAVQSLACNGDLRALYKRANTQVPSVQTITHHGWIHIVMVWFVARVIGPLLGLQREGDIDEQAVVEAGCLLHDSGLSKERPRHAVHGAGLVEELLAPFGLAPRVIDIIRLLVRFHRADDYLWLMEEIIPRWQYILERLRAGDDLASLVKANDPEEDPSADDVRLFLELMESGVRMVKMLAVLMIADLVDIGRTRVRQGNRKVFFHHLKESLRKKGHTLEDILKRRKIRYSEYDLANFAVLRLQILLQDEDGQRAASILVQEEQVARKPTGQRDAKTHVNHHTWKGLFSWARKFADLDDESSRREFLLLDPPCIQIAEEPARPTHFVLRVKLDREICAPGRVEAIKRVYIGALAAAVRASDMESEFQIATGLEF